MTGRIGSHRASLGKGCQDLGEPRDGIASKLRVVDLTVDWASVQNYVGRPPLCRQSQQLFTVIAIKRQPTFGNFDALLSSFSDLQGHVATRSGELSLKRVNLGVELFCCSASPLANYYGYLGNLLPTRIARYRSFIKGIEFSATAFQSLQRPLLCRIESDPLVRRLCRPDCVDQNGYGHLVTRRVQCIRHVS
jgi:hypothetical protein